MYERWIWYLSLNPKLQLRGSAADQSKVAVLASLVGSWVALRWTSRTSHSEKCGENWAAGQVDRPRNLSGKANQASQTMSALSNIFCGTLLHSLKRVFSSASLAVFRIGLAKRSSFVI